MLGEDGLGQGLAQHAQAQYSLTYVWALDRQRKSSAPILMDRGKFRFVTVAKCL